MTELDNILDTIVDTRIIYRLGLLIDRHPDILALLKEKGGFNQHEITLSNGDRLEIDCRITVNQRGKTH
jgi:hypothetical protein